MRNVFEYLEYSFFTLFSSRFGRIIGSSILVDILLTLGSTSIIYFTVKDLLSDYSAEGLSSLSEYSLKILFLILVILLLGIMNLAWKYIIIPIRSIEQEKKEFNLDDDFTLFQRSIPYYLSYITWYSVILLIWILVFFGGGYLLWNPERYGPLFLFGVIMILVWIIIQISLSLTWYAISIKPSFGLEGFRESLRLTAGKRWSIFIKIFVFSCILGLAGGVLSSMSSLIPFPSTASDIILLDTPSVSGERNIGQLSHEMMKEMTPIFESLLPKLLTFLFLYRIEGVLFLAMMQIFLMRLTLDIRFEADTQKS